MAVLKWTSLSAEWPEDGGVLEHDCSVHLLFSVSLKMMDLWPEGNVDLLKTEAARKACTC